MTENLQPPAPAHSRARWGVVALVFFAIMLNYVDRQILALLKPTLETEFAWSDQDYGNMASAFQFAAAIAFLGTGWFIDRVGLRIGFAAGVLVWSLAGMAHAFVSGVTGFIGARVVLGAAESIGTPAAVKSAATYFGPKDRSIALGIGNTAPNVGAVITPLVIPALALAFGWRAAFLVAGGLGIVWVVAWFAFKMPAAIAETGGPAPIRWVDLFRDRRTLAIAVAKVLSDQVWFFMLSWLPDLFHRLFGLQQGAVGLPVALVYALLILPVPIVLSLHSPWTAALVLGLGLFAHQGFSTNVFALTTDVMPARSVGSTIGIAAFCGNMGSIGMIQLSAWSLGNGFGYAPMLAICAVSYLLALGVVQLLIPRIEPAR